MINTATPTAAAEEPQVTDKATTKKSPATKPRAAKKSPAAKKKTAAKKVARKSVQAKKPKPAASKATEKTKPVKETKQPKQKKQPKQTKQKVIKPKTSKAGKPKKPKLVRDSFTMPEQEYAVLGQVKKICHAGGMDIKKSELLRIGIAQLAAMGLKKLKTAQAALTPLRAGRPKKHK